MALKKISLLFSILLVNFLSAQNKPFCSTDEMQVQLFENQPELIKGFHRANAQLQKDLELFRKKGSSSSIEKSDAL